MLVYVFAIQCSVFFDDTHSSNKERQMMYLKYRYTQLLLYGFLCRPSLWCYYVTALIHSDANVCNDIQRFPLLQKKKIDGVSSIMCLFNLYVPKSRFRMTKSLWQILSCHLKISTVRKRTTLICNVNFKSYCSNMNIELWWKAKRMQCRGYRLTFVFHLNVIMSRWLHHINNTQLSD